jgi:hypothetical protein
MMPGSIKPPANRTPRQNLVRHNGKAAGNNQ